MKHLIFKVNSQSLQRLENFKPAAGSVGYLTASFEFSSDWDGTAKTAKCRVDKAIYDATINSNGVCTIPWEVLAVDTTKQIFGKQSFYIWVEGIDGAKVITTDEVKIELNAQGAGEEQNASDPTPSAYAQFVEDVKAETKASADTATAQATNATASAESAAASAASLKNDYSNALKGNASGAVIRVDDVSPVEHMPVVKVHSKNIIPYPYVGTFGEVNGVTFTDNGDGTITASGTASSANYAVVILQKNMALKDGVTYHIGTENNPSALLFAYKDETGTTRYIRNGSITWSNKYTFVQLYLQYSKGQAVDELVKPYMVMGDTATEYTPYIDPSTATVTDSDGNTYTPKADGTVDGITSTMIKDGISTETEGMTIECEYNRDINKVIADILTQLAGG